jgi:hypothetical protein
MPRKPKDPPESPDMKAYWKSIAEMPALASEENLPAREHFSGASAAPGALLKSSLWQAGYAEGVYETLQALLDDEAATKERARQIVGMSTAMKQQLARANALRERALDPAVKAARTQRLKRMQRDEAQAAEFAALIRAGESTETARAKMGVGAVRAKRLRAIAVKMKWIRSRQRKAGSIP